MKCVWSIVIILLIGTVVFGQKKTKSQNTKTKSKSTEVKKEETPTSEWILYKTFKDRKSLYEQSTIIRNGDMLKVWTKTVENSDNSYVLMLEEINCKEREWRGLTAYVYGADKSLIKKIQSDSLPDSSPIQPDSIAHILSGVVCKLVK